MDDAAHGVFGKLDFVGQEAVLAPLARDEITVGDAHFFSLGITREGQDFHAVTQGGRDGVQQVGGGDKHHLRQVKGHVQVMVTKLAVLLRV